MFQSLLFWNCLRRIVPILAKQHQLLKHILNFCGYTPDSGNRWGILDDRVFVDFWDKAFKMNSGFEYKN